MATKSLQVTIDATDREEAESIFKELGLDTSTAVRLFIKSVIRTRSIPFPLDIGRPVVSEITLDPERTAQVEAVGEAFGAYLAKMRR